jgi:hypothetical protein
MVIFWTITFRNGYRGTRFFSLDEAGRRPGRAFAEPMRAAFRGWR